MARRLLPYSRCENQSVFFLGGAGGHGYQLSIGDFVDLSARERKALLIIVREDEIPAILVILTLLYPASMTKLLEIDEATYREQCLSGFVRTEASEGVLVRVALARL
ncbi:hypothetical protein AG1IA_09647 [Rhizoctonia solani AG-1 IA]|uniref:Uncharacterized protein n=1 Tax=Thanatephorus cucumeris (strain AG1-IA) TaxID=983506 RepID=L8WHS1_THACA|nr:hypothetical protein AG1IA_09647 [Rhizoctonia solani AG-1 IA]